MLSNILMDLLPKTEKTTITEDLNDVLTDKKSIYWLIRKYEIRKNEKEIRYKIIGIKRRINDIKLLKREVYDMIINS